MGADGLQPLRVRFVQVFFNPLAVDGVLAAVTVLGNAAKVLPLDPAIKDVDGGMEGLPLTAIATVIALMLSLLLLYRYLYPLTYWQIIKAINKKAVLIGICKYKT